MTCTPCAHSPRSVGWLINNWTVKNKNMESKEPGVGEGPAKVVSVSLPEGTVRLLFGEDISESLLELLANGRVAGKGLERERPALALFAAELRAARGHAGPTSRRFDVPQVRSTPVRGNSRVGLPFRFVQASSITGRDVPK